MTMRIGRAGGTLKRGAEGLAYQSSHPGVFWNSIGNVSQFFLLLFDAIPARMRSASVPIFHCFGSVDTTLIRNDLLDLDRSPGNPAPLLFWNAGLLDHLVPFTDIGFEPGGNLLRRARFRLGRRVGGLR